MSLGLILFLFLFVFFCLGWYWFDPIYTIGKTSPPNAKIAPGPFRLPWIGCLPQIYWARQHLLNFGLDCLSSFGTTFRWGIPGMWQYLIISGEPEIAEHILSKNFSNYPKGPSLVALLADLLGGGIFVSNGDTWRAQRKTASHLFKTGNLKELMLHSFLKHSTGVLRILEDHAQSGKIVEVEDLFYRYTFDSISVIGFGQEINSLEKHSPILEAFNTAQICIDWRNLNPQYKYLPESELKSSVKILDAFAYEIIKQRRADSNVSSKTDLLSLYLTQNSEISDLELRDVILNFLIAGRDTTGQTLTWLFFNLAQNQNALKKLLHEIDTVLGNQEPTFELLKKMPYLLDCINETLRLYPPVPIDPKQAIEADTLPGGWYVPKGASVAWCAWLMGRIEKYWGKEVHNFVPERWGTELVKNRHEFLFIPFQAGPRICLGKHMAYLEVQIMTCKVLQKYTLSLAPEQKINEPRVKITLSTKEGMKMLVQPRVF